MNSRGFIAANARRQFAAYCQVSIAAYQAAGGTPDTCQRDVVASLESLGHVELCHVTFAPAPAEWLGNGTISFDVVFTPTNDVAAESLDAKILYGVNFVPVTERIEHGQTVDQRSIAVPANEALPPFANYVVDMSTVTANVDLQAGAALPGPTLPGIAAAFTTRQSTDGAVDGTSAAGQTAGDLADAIQHFGDGLNLSTIEYAAIAIAVLVGLVATAYLVHSARTVIG